MPWLLDRVCPYLTTSDLAILARTSREVKQVVYPHLYGTISFHCSGRIEEQDDLLRKLELFSEPYISGLEYTTRLSVTGSWYETYDEVESHISAHRLLSPAVRMFNSLIASVVTRIPHLRIFIWDMQISMTQSLITTVMQRSSVECVQLRLGTDCTPKPFFHPILELNKFLNIRVMRFLYVDNNEVLESLGLAVSKANTLQELTIWAEEDNKLVLKTLLDSCKRSDPLYLSSLDLRGFDRLDTTPRHFWNVFLPTKLYDLTLQLGAGFFEQEGPGIWSESITQGLRPVRLSTNLTTPDLEDLVMSFSGLEALCLNRATPSQLTYSPLDRLMHTLHHQHSSTINVLTSCSQYIGTIDFPYTVYTLATQFPKLKELRVFVTQEDVKTLLSSLVVSELCVLHLLFNELVTDEMKSTFRDALIDVLNREDIPAAMKYIAFEDEEVYRVSRRQTTYQLLRHGLVGHIADSFLLGEKAFDWLAIGSSARPGEVFQ